MSHRAGADSLAKVLLHGRMAFPHQIKPHLPLEMVTEFLC